MQPLKGIHHVTAITGDAQGNVDFYSGVLGLKLVKKTVNFDDPDSYHLYYGDHQGSPGTLLTFFAWPGASLGRAGAGEPTAVAYSVPPGSLTFWKDRLNSSGIGIREAGTRFGSEFLSFADPEGMTIELVAAGAPANVPSLQAIHAVTLSLSDPSPSAALYTNELTFAEVGEESGRARHSIGSNRESFVDIVFTEKRRGHMGAGTIHHVAFRTEDDSSQLEWLEHVTAIGLHASPVMDRKYFHSIYFRELNGVLFEIATDPPGMAIDEPAEQLGERLMLPTEYEPLRSRLERTLPPLTTRVEARL